MTKLNSTKKMLQLMQTEGPKEVTTEALAQPNDMNEKALQLVPGPNMVDLLDQCLKQELKAKPSTCI